MSISDRSGIAVVVGCAVALLTLVRCAPTESCLRLSDCDVGMTCVSGACVMAVASSDVDGGASLEGSAPVATPVATDATASVPDGAIARDAAVDADAGDAGIVDAGEIDTSDF